MKDLNVKLDAILQKHKEIERKLSNQENIDTNKLVKLNKEYSELAPLVGSITEYKVCQNDINNLKKLVNDKYFAESKILRDFSYEHARGTGAMHSSREGFPSCPLPSYHDMS